MINEEGGNANQKDIQINKKDSKAKQKGIQINDEDSKISRKIFRLMRKTVNNIERYSDK